MAMKRKHPDPNELRPGVPLIPKPEEVPPGYDPKNPWAVDMLDRSDHAEILTRYIEGINQPYVLAINAGWGQGKSLFLRMWRDDLVNRQHRHCILFNAWESDFGDDPLVALMGAVSDYVVALQPSDESELVAKVKGLWRKGWAFAKVAPKHLLKAGVRYVATKGLDIKEWASDAESASEETSDGGVGKCIADELADATAEVYGTYLLQKDSMQGFRTQLSAVAKDLTVDGFPLVIMIDELDRCRPDYAVLLLERIKHLFSVPGVVFILALEAVQLSRTIHALYGLDLETGARTYLRKFIDREYTFPKPSHEQFADYICAQYNFGDLPGPKREAIDIEIHKLFGELSNVFMLSLRDMAQLAAQTAAVVRSYKANWVEASLVLTLLVIQFQAPKTYTMINGRRLDWRSVMDSLIKEDKINIQHINRLVRGFLESIFNCIGMARTSYNKWHHNIMKDTAPPHENKAHEEYINIIKHTVGILDNSISHVDHYLSAVEFGSRFDLPVAKEVEEVIEDEILTNPNS